MMGIYKIVVLCIIQVIIYVMIKMKFHTKQQQQILVWFSCHLLYNSYRLPNLHTIVSNQFAYFVKIHIYCSAR